MLVYREHPISVLPFNVLTFDGMGLLLAVAFLSVIAFLPLALAFFAVLLLMAYAVDIWRQPLQEYSEEEIQAERKGGVRMLLFFFGFLVVGVAAYIFDA